jgi:hypothetical protein
MAKVQRERQEAVEGTMETYVLILLAYVMGADSTRLTHITMPQKYESEADCVEAGQSMKFVSTRNAEDLRIGFICIENGTVEDDDDDDDDDE